MAIRLLTSGGKIISTGTLKQMISTIKHHMADGDYHLDGPGVHRSVHRFDGFVYRGLDEADRREFLHLTTEERNQRFGLPEEPEAEGQEMTARELLDQYQRREGLELDALVNGWFDHSAVIEILCNSIDEADTIDEFAEFLSDNFDSHGKEPGDVPTPIERQEHGPA